MEALGGGSKARSARAENLRWLENKDTLKGAEVHFVTLTLK